MARTVAEVSAETINETIFKKVWPEIRKLDNVDRSSDSISLDKADLDNALASGALHVNIRTAARHSENHGTPNLLKKAWERALDAAGLHYTTEESEHVGTKYTIPLSVDGVTQDKLEALAGEMQQETQQMKGSRKAAAR